MAVGLSTQIGGSPAVAALRKRVSAARLGVFFGRTTSFRLPSSVVIERERREVCFPNETGVRVAFLEVLVEDCYGISLVPRPVKTILDIGANVGIFSLAARKAAPSARIHSYEPNAALERWLRIQSAAARSEYFLEAVTREGGNVRLDVHPDSVQTRTHPDVAGNVPAVSLRTAVDRLGGFVDFVKIDCEGGEWDLFKDQGIWDRFARLSLEYHLLDRWSHQTARRTVESLGFTVLGQQPAATFGLILAERA